MSKRRDHRKQLPRSDTLRRICLAALTALSIASPLILSESVAPSGSGVLLVALHLVLAVAWLTSKLLSGQGAFRCDGVSLALVGLVAWHGISALVMGPQGAPRPAINMLWQWVGYGTAFLLARDLVRTPRECRAVCAAMIGLAVCLSAHAYYQYFIEMPAVREAYRQDAERLLHEQRLYSPTGSVAREMFESRLFSSEPTATFALTNSLAGFLAPWLVLTVAAAVATRRQRAGGARYYGGVMAVALFVGGCLLLTKSRTAVLAAGVGLLLLAGVGVASRWKLGWKIPLAASATLAVLIVGAVGVGTLDVQVVSEAPKSLLYRFQYWHGALRLIADHPWFGCGPGNFQQYYTAYMLPQASEQVADPHNFLFEVWATAGTPAMLLLVAALGMFAWRVVREDGSVPAVKPDETEPEVARQGSGSFAWSADGPIYAGAVGGLLLAFPVGLIAGLMPAAPVFWLGLPVAAAAIWGLQPWVADGVLGPRTVGIAVAVLLVNLLAAGGIGFPGVAGSVWLLMAVGLNLAPCRGFEWSAPRRVGWVLLAVVVSLLAACFQTAYLPVLNGRVWQDRGEVLVYASRELTDPVEVQRALLAALQAFEEAAEADRFAAEPRMNAAQIYHQLALQLPDDAAKAAAAEHCSRMAQEALDRDRRSQARVAGVGYMDFETYNATDNYRHLTRSRDRFQRAVELFPSNNFARARLAWTHHLAGDGVAAAEEAAEALRLDALTPHQERKLAQRGIFDDLAAPRQLAQLRRVPAGESAEQLMKRLRNESEESLP